MGLLDTGHNFQKAGKPIGATRDLRRQGARMRLRPTIGWVQRGTPTMSFNLAAWWHGMRVQAEVQLSGRPVSFQQGTAAFVIALRS